MKKYDYLIVGAGLFGAVFAHEMTERGKKCLVVERREHIGGNIYTETVEGIHVHKYGAHIFHTKREDVWAYINRFAKFNNFVNSPIARFRGETYNLPFNMNTFSRLWGVFTPEEAAKKIAEQRAAAGITDPKNLEEQAISLVGIDVYEKLIKGYTEKQWGRDAVDLPAFIIRRVPVRFTYDNNYFNDPHQGIPEGGYTPIVEKLLAGSEVKLGCDFFSDRKALEGMAERVVYTGPLDKLFGCRFGALEYRGLRFETKVLDMENFQGNAVVNYTAREVPYTRVIEHKHFEFGKQPKTVISYEYPEKWVEGAEPYYPINDEKNTALAARYLALAKEERYLVGGRLATYRYYDMDAVIAEALSAVKEEYRGEMK